MNPFKYGKEVSGYQFYDRRKSCDDLHRKMVDGSTNVVLFAPRRYGKTSLVLKVLKRLHDEDGMLGMLFDMNKVPTLEQFCETYANAVYALVGGRRELLHKVMDYLVHLHPTFSLSAEGVPTIRLDFGERMTALSISEVLDLPEKLSRDLGDRPLTIAFDEFQEVGCLSDEFPLEKIFRSCIQAHRNVRYVFLGSKTHLMKRMFGDRSRAFYKSALLMPLDKPPVEESLEFVVSRFADCGLVASSAVAESILDVSENIPYYLQAISSFVYEAATSAQRTEIEAGDVKAAVELMVKLNAPIYTTFLQSVSASQQTLLRALAEEPVAVFDDSYRLRHRLPVSSTVHSALKSLVNDGTVEQRDGRYRIEDPMLIRYLLSSPATIFKFQGANIER